MSPSNSPNMSLSSFTTYNIQQICGPGLSLAVTLLMHEHKFKDLVSMLTSAERRLRNQVMRGLSSVPT